MYKLSLCILGALLATSITFWAFAQPGPLLLDEAVQSIEVTVLVGKDGADLTDVIGVDLGVGFPFWLQPTSAEPRPSLAFGAVPQESSVQDKVAAGASGTFTFRASGDAGQDALQVTKQLLAGLTVGDLSSVGFIGLPGANWVLAGYAMKVNGKVIVAEMDLDLGAKTVQDKAAARLADLVPKAGPLNEERNDLLVLVQTQLASAADKKRLADVDKELAEFGPERVRLQRQLRGQFPWYAKAIRDAKPVAPKGATLTVVTDTHEQADTRNYVYFRVGGRRYLIGDPEFPLTGQNGPQELVLDLLGIPLRSEDLRDYGLGMLAAPVAWSAGPDRWHPRRVKLEVDGKVVYDSEDEDLDRRSLEAIRLVPTHQWDAKGKAVANSMSGREVSVWNAGKGQGLNAGKRPVELTGKFQTEDGQSLQPGKGDDLRWSGPPKNVKVGGDEIVPPQRAQVDPGSLLPGELPPVIGSQPQGGNANAGPGSILNGPAPEKVPDLGGNIPGGPPGPVVPPPTVPGLPPTEPQATGTVIQIDTVGLQVKTRFTGNLLVTVRNYSIDWAVSGDEKNVDHYDVFLDVLNIEEIEGGPVLRSVKLGEVAPGSRFLGADGEVIDGFVAGRVVAIPKADSALTPHSKTSNAYFTPARPALPTFTPAPHAFSSAAAPTLTANLPTHRGIIIGEGQLMPIGVPGNVLLNFPPNPAPNQWDSWGGVYPFQTLMEAYPCHFYIAFHGGPAPANNVSVNFSYERRRTTTYPNGSFATIDKLYPAKVTQAGKTLVPQPLDWYLIDGAGPAVKVELGPQSTSPPLGLSADDTMTDRGFIHLRVSFRNAQGDKTRPPFLFGLHFRPH